VKETSNLLQESSDSTVFQNPKAISILTLEGTNLLGPQSGMNETAHSILQTTLQHLTMVILTPTTKMIASNISKSLSQTRHAYKNTEEISGV